MLKLIEKNEQHDHVVANNVFVALHNFYKDITIRKVERGLKIRENKDPPLLSQKHFFNPIFYI